MAADPYALLGVAPGASKADIKKAFRAKAKAHHPDMHHNAPDSVKQAHDAAFKALNEAFSSLMDGTHRPRSYPGQQGGFARAGYGAGGYGARSGASTSYDPFASSYRGATGSSYSGWQHFRRRTGFDVAGMFRSFQGVSRASAAFATTLGVLLAGSVLLLDPVAASLWERRNQGKLYRDIENDSRRRKQQQQQAAAEARAAATAALREREAAASAGLAAAGAAVPAAQLQALGGEQPALGAAERQQADSGVAAGRAAQQAGLEGLGSGGGVP